MPKPTFIPNSIVHFKVKNRSGKKNLANYLASRLGVAQAWAEELILLGCVSLDGTLSGPEEQINLSAGPHDIVVHFPETWPKHMGATPMNLTVIHEDEELVALDKPPGIVVHPARGHLDGNTLQNGMRHRFRHLLGQSGITIGPAHRLDKDTSGVVLYSLTTRAYTDLARQFAKGETRKEYLAVVDGVPNFTSRRCELPIGNDPAHKGRGKHIPIEQGGKNAMTDFTVIEKGDGWALVRVFPHTGRPHQIRIHAACLGLPLAGDREYNPHHGDLGFARQALHATAISFRHPFTGSQLRLESPLAQDLNEALEQLRSR